MIRTNSVTGTIWLRSLGQGKWPVSSGGARPILVDEGDGAVYCSAFLGATHQRVARALAARKSIVPGRVSQ